MNAITVKIPEQDLRTILLLIRMRQDECRDVPDFSPVKAKFADLDVKLEKMKMNIANQMTTRMF